VLRTRVGEHPGRIRQWRPALAQNLFEVFAIVTRVARRRQLDPTQARRRDAVIDCWLAKRDVGFDQGGILCTRCEHGRIDLRRKNQAMWSDAVDEAFGRGIGELRIAPDR
jgi:hypothetical protein